MKRINILIFAVLVTALLDGCDTKTVPHPLPIVNDANCQMETINKIEDRAAREQFAGLCSRRSVGIVPTEKPKNWLDLSDPKDKR
ncbi:MAG: trbK [Polaromonas sp.]|jgi:entry exclusion lipoprotein TrbK|nr:trbK [Polaromonas sp.]